MKLVWCWRCKSEIPMLSDEQWVYVRQRFDTAMKEHRDFKRVGLEEYERITGHRETNFNALWHHIISIYGPPCPRCNKALRTPAAFKCFECGFVVHEPNWTYLFQTETDAFEIPGKGFVSICKDETVGERISEGEQIEFRNGSNYIGFATILSIQRMLTSNSQSHPLGLLLKSTTPQANFKASQTVWIAHSTLHKRDLSRKYLILPTLKVKRPQS